ASEPLRRAAADARGVFQNESCYPRKRPRTGAGALCLARVVLAFFGCQGGSRMFNLATVSFRSGHVRVAFLVVCAALALLDSESSQAQLTDCAQIDYGHRVNAPGGCIAKPYAQQIGPGQGDMTTAWSSTYLIKRDPARAIRRGRQLFQRKFTVQEGLG